MIDVALESFFKPFLLSYKVLEQYVIANLLTFVRGFEMAIVLTLAVIFLLITVGITIRRARRLPRSYIIEIIDLDGRRTIVDGLRQSFATYEAASSYARLYGKMFGHQYKFKVVGSDKTLLAC